MEKILISDIRDAVIEFYNNCLSTIFWRYTFLKFKLENEKLNDVIESYIASYELKDDNEEIYTPFKWRADNYNQILEWIVEYRKDLYFKAQNTSMPDNELEWELKVIDNLFPSSYNLSQLLIYKKTNYVNVGKPFRIYNFNIGDCCNPFGGCNQYRDNTFIVINEERKYFLSDIYCNKINTLENSVCFLKECNKYHFKCTMDYIDVYFDNYSKDKEMEIYIENKRIYYQPENVYVKVIDEKSVGVNTMVDFTTPFITNKLYQSINTSFTVEDVFSLNTAINKTEINFTI